MGEVWAATQFPTFHAAKIQNDATARHAVASGKLDMVCKTCAHMAKPAMPAEAESHLPIIRKASDHA